ncbi:hypothetical protein HRI_002327800 [Hibiscus trionum]|uniref:Uncharacterized protein n=1 Tax=Hibiscus trionum TaxID=183268 RepID=A0A9W7M5M3_HIBTR|nr:hypothetical protein HRI_002327800 [Hibiscus trionum]
MSVSIEALAMAGVDYMEWGIHIEDWEREDELPPPHLLADDDGEEEQFMRRRFQRSFSCNNNNNNNVEEDSGTKRVGDPGMVQWRRRMETIWLCLLSMVQTMIKLLMIISWLCLYPQDQRRYL